ncbi:MAG: hypothetical protein KDC69_12020 [Flavobacteriaceae bacterium]|nr:hypothetical protein [Flavobacteriaceae bacterium]
MKKDIDFKFKFKGNRKYIHGTDLFNECVKMLENEGLSEVSDIDMSFHKIMKQQLKGYLMSEDELSETDHFSFVFSFKFKDKKYFIGLNEVDMEVEGRYEYPEEQIVELSKFQEADKSILLSDPISFSFIEKIVALNKGLLERLFPEISGKWYFTLL